MCALFPLVCEHVPSAFFIIPKLGENKIVGALVDCSAPGEAPAFFAVVVVFWKSVPRTSYSLPMGENPGKGGVAEAPGHSWPSPVASGLAS